MLPTVKLGQTDVLGLTASAVVPKAPNAVLEQNRAEYVTTNFALVRLRDVADKIPSCIRR